MSPSDLPPAHIPESDEFGIDIDYRAHSEAPSRVFLAMWSLIKAFEEIDGLLVESARSSLRPTMILEAIEAGSLRAWLRNLLLSVEDDALKSGDWKKVVGAFLVNAKRIMIEWTEKRTTITSAVEVDELRQQILDEATRTNILGIPAYLPIPAIDIARSVQLISEAVKPLAPGDSVRYLSTEKSVDINLSFSVAPATLTDLLVKESLPSESYMILIVKRPDFLGEARWEFRHGRQMIEAKLLDEAWLVEFRNGTVVLKPGDALKAIVRSLAHYGYDGEFIDSKHEVIKVLEVIHASRPTQSGLF